MSKLTDLIEKVASGKISFHEVEKFCGMEEAVMIRRKALEKMSGSNLWKVGSNTIDLGKIAGHNIDNPIGAVQVPVGVAGPIKVNGRRHPIFMATTEGALVASVNRGAGLINAAGGAKAYVTHDVMTRAPVFLARNAGDAIEFVNWMGENAQRIASEAEKTTKHGKMVGLQPFIFGRNVWLRFAYRTGEAMGMNMVTIATQRACEWIAEKQKKVRCISLAGNLDIDKKAAWVNFLAGRGKSVIAEAVIPEKLLKEKMRCSADELIEVNYRKNLLGAAVAGSLGFNAHFANTVAAMFIALGQDAAHTVDGSMGVTTVEKEGNGAYASVTMPALYVGTVGGGTKVETQAELLGASGVKNAVQLAELVAAATLAGEISLLGALASNEFARAHERLGR